MHALSSPYSPSLPRPAVSLLLGADPRRAWKGPWRWFHEALLDCCAPLPRVARDGITLTQARVASGVAGGGAAANSFLPDGVSAWSTASHSKIVRSAGLSRADLRTL